MLISGQNLFSGSLASGDNLLQHALHEPTLERTLPLPAQPLVLVISGSWGAGKTTLANKIINAVAATNNEKGLILNELGSRSVNADIERFPSDVDLRLVDGCVCCTSNPEAIDAARSLIFRGAKIVVIEQSGLAEGSPLVRALHKALNGIIIKGVTIFDPDARVSSTVHHNVNEADGLIIKNSDSFSDLSLLREKGFEHLDSPIMVVDLNQGIDKDFWRGLVGQQRVNRGCECCSHGHDHHQHGDLRDDSHHAHDLENFSRLDLILYPSVSLEDLKSLLENGEIKIPRAKGVIGNLNFDWVCGEDQKGKFTCEVRKQPSSIFEGRPFISLYSDSEQVLSIDQFSDIGTYDFSAENVDYVLGQYLSSEDIARNVLSGNPIPVQCEADQLFIEGLKIVDKIAQNSDSTVIENFVNSWSKIVGRYFNWRLDLFPLIRTGMQQSDQSLIRSSADSAIQLGFSTSQAFIKTYGSLDAGLVPGLLERVREFQPVKLMFEGMAGAQRARIEFRDELTDLDIEWFATITALGVQLGELDQVLIDRALSNLENLVGADSQHPWRENLSKLTTIIRSQL